MEKTKKGQAAIDYLATSSWAILVVLLIIGVFGYYYAINLPGPAKCTIKGQIECYDSKIENEEISILLKNNLASQTIITKVSVRQKDLRIKCELIPATEQRINTGQTGELLINTCVNYDGSPLEDYSFLDDKNEYNLTIDYALANGNYISQNINTVYGEISR